MDTTALNSENGKDPLQISFMCNYMRLVQQHCESKFD